VAGVKPVEERGARAADVQIPGRRRSESDARFHGPDLTTGEPRTAIAATKGARTAMSFLAVQAAQASRTNPSALSFRLVFAQG
jgi:hypothetical protein